MGGKGGGGSIDTPEFGSFLNDIMGGFNKTNKRYKEFWKKDPLLQGQRDFALDQAYPQLSELFKNLPPATELTGPLQALLGGLPNISQLTQPLQGQIPILQGLQGGLQSRMGNLMNVAPTLAKTFQTQIAPVLTSGGKLTREQQLEADRASNAASALAGMANSNQGLARGLLNRDLYRRQRFAEAQQGAGALEGIQGQDVAARLGLTGGIGQLTQGLTGLTQGIQGLRTSDIANRLGLSQGIQGIRGTDITQRLGLGQGIEQLLAAPGNTAVGQFATLMNPLYGLGGNWLNAQTAGQTAQAGAESNKKGGTMEGIGAIAGMVGAIAL